MVIYESLERRIPRRKAAMSQEPLLPLACDDFTGWGVQEINSHFAFLLPSRLLPTKDGSVRESGVWIRDSSHPGHRATWGVVRTSQEQMKGF